MGRSKDPEVARRPGMVLECLRRLESQPCNNGCGNLQDHRKITVPSARKLVGEELSLTPDQVSMAIFVLKQQGHLVSVREGASSFYHVTRGDSPLEAATEVPAQNELAEEPEASESVEPRAGGKAEVLPTAKSASFEEILTRALERLREIQEGQLARIAELEAQNTDLVADKTRLEGSVAELRAELEDQKDRVVSRETARQVRALEISFRQP